MLISELKGLKYPDDYIIRFFFKKHLNNKIGSVIELGCGNGNNLSLFYQYGWDIAGVDISKRTINEANNNFTIIQDSHAFKNKFKFYCQDMNIFVKNYKDKPFDVLLLPSSIYYIDYKGIEGLFKNIKEKKIIKKSSLIFIRCRTPQDYRFGRGRLYKKKSFILDNDETQEKGCVMTFLYESDILNILERNFILKNKQIFYTEFDNIQNNFLIHNSDLVLWCEVDKIRM